MSEVYARPECVFRYCPNFRADRPDEPNPCADACLNPAREVGPVLVAAQTAEPAPQLTDEDMEDLRFIELTQLREYKRKAEILLDHANNELASLRTQLAEALAHGIEMQEEYTEQYNRAEAALERETALKEALEKDLCPWHGPQPEGMKPYPFDQPCGTKAFVVTKPCERARRALSGEQAK